MFIQNAEAVSARVSVVQGMDQVLDRAVGLGLETEARSLAAPDLEPERRAMLDRLCREKGVKLLGPGLGSEPWGVGVGLTRADWGAARTGTLVMDSRDEDSRLASMICQIHLAVLPSSGLVESLADLAPALSQGLAGPPAYLAFITGPSRTADIERVLTLGAHGPLELHILILEGE